MNDLAYEKQRDGEKSHVESIAYPGFSDEDAEILHRYEGTKGKKVIRKVNSSPYLDRFNSLLTFTI